MTDKATSLQRLDEEFQHLRSAIDGLDRPRLEQPWYDGWSVKDILAHILGWEREMIPVLGRIARGERPTPEGVDYSDSDAWNAKFAHEWHAILAPTVIAAWQQTHMAFVKAVQAIPDDRFGVKDDGKPTTATRLVEGTGYGHFREHLGPITEWRRQQGL